MARLDHGAVKFVTSHLGPGRCQQLIMIGDHGLVVQRQSLGHDRLSLDRAHHGQPVHAAAQIEQSGALGDRRRTGVDRCSDVGSQRVVRRQLGCVHLGKPPAQVEPSRPSWKLLI